MTASRRLAFACILAVLLAPAAAPAKDAPEPVAVDAASDAATLAARVLTLTEAGALKGVRRVAVPQFSVRFTTADQVSAETSGFAAAGRASVNARYLLTGVAQPEFQALVDALYAGFLRDLQASGLEVVPFDQVAAAASYRKLAAAGLALPARDDAGVTVAPPGMALYGVQRMLAQPAQGGLMAGLSGFADAASAIGSIGDVMALGKELGDAVLLDVHLRVNFVELRNDNKGFLGRLSSTASVSAKAYPSIGQATMGVQVGPTRATVSLAQPLTLDARAIAAVKEQAKSTGAVAGEVAAGLLRMAIGNKDSASFSTYEAVADPARYPEVVGAGLGLTGQMLVQRLKGAR